MPISEKKTDMLPSATPEVPPVLPAASAVLPATAEANAFADGARAKELATKARTLLEAAKYNDAIEMARHAVQADPSEALAYLYWGSALIEKGKALEARGVFRECVKQAIRGPVAECRRFR